MYVNARYSKCGLILLRHDKLTFFTHCYRHCTSSKIMCLCLRHTKFTGRIINYSY